MDTRRYVRIEDLGGKLNDFFSTFSCPGEWIKGSDVKLKAKHVPISELNATQLNRLLPPIYAYQSRRHGQRKRSIISALQSK